MIMRKKAAYAVEMLLECCGKPYRDGQRHVYYTLTIRISLSVPPTSC